MDEGLSRVSHCYRPVTAGKNLTKPQWRKKWEWMNVRLHWQLENASAARSTVTTCTQCKVKGKLNKMQLGSISNKLQQSSVTSLLSTSLILGADLRAGLLFQLSLGEGGTFLELDAHFGMCEMSSFTGALLAVLCISDGSSRWRRLFKDTLRCLS